MPDLKVFSKMGLMLIRDFLDRQLSLEIIQEISARDQYSAAIRNTADDSKVDESIRNVGYVSLSRLYDQQIYDLMKSAIPLLEAHFCIKLTGFEYPQYLVYRIGSFYLQHRDVHRNRGISNSSNQRRISVVIFLNDESDVDGAFSGGNLTFYGLMKNPPWDKCGLPLKGESGLLVAFPSDLVHEVTPVTHGVRYTIVTWFY